MQKKSTSKRCNGTKNIYQKDLVLITCDLWMVEAKGFFSPICLHAFVVPCMQKNFTSKRYSGTEKNIQKSLVLITWDLWMVEAKGFFSW